MIFVKMLFYFYLFEGGGKREERGSRRKGTSRLCAESNIGFNHMTLRSGPEQKTRSQMLNQRVTQAPH